MHHVSFSSAYVVVIVIKIEVTGTWRVIYVIHIYIKYNYFCSPAQPSYFKAEHL